MKISDPPGGRALRAAVRGPASRSRPHRLMLPAAAGFALLVATGCAPGIRWHFGTYEDVHAEGRAGGKLVFAYLRSWASPACTDFEEHVLKREDVLQATADLVCVPLNFNWDTVLAQQWGFKEPPAYVIVDPEGNVLARGSGNITADALLQAIASARQKFAAQPRAAPRS